MSDGQKAATNNRSKSVVVDNHGSASVAAVAVTLWSLLLMTCFVFLLNLMSILGQRTSPAMHPRALYRQPDLPIEKRIADLLGRMTLKEKVRQLDLYSGATALVDQHTDSTHATPQAAFLPDKAEALWGNLGVGRIHDLNPTPEQANVIQKWINEHNRLGIPALFIEEALHGFDTGTVFPAPINLAATWNLDIAQRTGAAIAAEARATGVDMILASVLDLSRDPRWGAWKKTLVKIRTSPGGSVWRLCAAHREKA